MREKIINLVFAKHDGNPKNYLFRVPLGIEIEAGTRIYVDTMRGESTAIASTDNFYVGKHTSDAIITGCGAYAPLKMVTGVAISIPGYQKRPFSDIPF